MNSSDTAQAAIKAALIKSTTDADFRALCLSHPIAALQQVAGVELPANAAIKFSEAADGSSIVLPPFSGHSDEITDEELLNEVSGGGQGGYSVATPGGYQPGQRPCC